MTAWLVRAGRYGERETFALSHDLAVIGWEELPNLDSVTARDELESLCRATYPDAKQNTIYNWVGQLWAFARRMQRDDLVVLPLKSRSAVAVGTVAGEYEYRQDLPDSVRHTRPVRWIRTDIPRAAFDRDLLFSLGAAQTVCQVQRNQAEERIRALIGERPVASDTSQSSSGATSEAEEAPPDIEVLAGDAIQAHIQRKFAGHDLARLVAAVLQAQGYQTEVSPAGPDGGVDIIAGRGPMGFDRPRLCVQVKSGSSPVDVKVLRELQGILRRFGAEQGLLVSWGGFKQSVYGEARQLFFEIRLWDAGKLVDAVLNLYEQFPEDLRAELPLKRIWSLVPEG